LAQGRAGAATNDDLARAAERSFRSVDRALLIPLERVEPWSDNPRLTLRNEVRGKDPDGIDDLAASIAERGILQMSVGSICVHELGVLNVAAGGLGEASVHQRLRPLPA